MHIKVTCFAALILLAAASISAQTTTGTDRYRVNTYDGERLVLGHATMDGQGVTGTNFGGALIGLGFGAMLPRWEGVNASYNWSERSGANLGLTVTLHF